MKIVGILLALVFLGVVVFALMAKKSSAKGQAENYCINLFVPLAEDTGFNPQELMAAFKQMWGIDLVCAQPIGEGTSKWPSGQYMVGNGSDRNNLYLTLTREPLKKEMVELLVKASKAGFSNNEPISESDVNVLKNHKAYFQIEYVHGKLPPKERVAFTAKLLLTLCKKYSACGIVNASAQSYIPTTKIASALFGSKDLSTPDIFPLFVNIQMISDGQQIDLHTHGMDQFWLPDIRIPFSDKDRVSYYYDIIRNSAVYMVENGKAMNIGDTAELAGDGKVFKVTEVAEEKDHPFGFYGVIGLKRL